MLPPLRLDAVRIEEFPMLGEYSDFTGDRAESVLIDILELSWPTDRLLAVCITSVLVGDFADFPDLD